MLATGNPQFWLWYFGEYTNHLKGNKICDIDVKIDTRKRRRVFTGRQRPKTLTTSFGFTAQTRRLRQPRPAAAAAADQNSSKFGQWGRWKERKAKGKPRRSRRCGCRRVMPLARQGVIILPSTMINNEQKIKLSIRIIQLASTSLHINIDQKLISYGFWMNAMRVYRVAV